MAGSFAGTAMLLDVWFCRHKGETWFSFATPGDAPMSAPRKGSVEYVFAWMRKRGYTVAQVGIADKDMLGIEYYG